MRKSKRASLTASLVGILLFLPRVPLVMAFTSQQKVELTATATVGTTPAAAFSFRVPQLLGQSLGSAQAFAFPGKNVVLPVQMVGGVGGGAPAGGFSASIPANIGVAPPNSGNLQVSMLYQLFDPSGFKLTQGFISVPISMEPDPNNPGNSIGTAVIPVASLQSALQGGSLEYKFQLKSGNQAPIEINSGGLSSGPPFHLQFVINRTYPVEAQGTTVTLPDTDMESTEGKTKVFFPAGSVSGPGDLVVNAYNPATVAAGPAGLAPMVAFDFHLQNANLTGLGTLYMSYGTNRNGTLIGSNGNGANLAPYSLDGGSWRIVEPYHVDTTAHVVWAPTTHFSTFALFLASGNGAADLRPRQRIITPNGDGINDTISFVGIGGTDVKILNVKGRRIRTLTVPNLVWDGRDDDGAIVESGIYIYQYNAQGERVSGVILIAK